MEEEDNHPFDESTSNGNNDNNTTDITSINIEPSKAGVEMIEYLKYLNEDDWSSDGGSYNEDGIYDNRDNSSFGDDGIYDDGERGGIQGL